MHKAKTAYEVYCNTCQKKLKHMGAERFWSKDFADECAEELGWSVRANVHKCPDCRGENA